MVANLLRETHPDHDRWLSHRATVRFFLQTRKMRKGALDSLAGLEVPVLWILAESDEIANNPKLITLAKRRDSNRGAPVRWPSRQAPSMPFRSKPPGFW